MCVRSLWSGITSSRPEPVPIARSDDGDDTRPACKTSVQHIGPVRVARDRSAEGRGGPAELRSLEGFHSDTPEGPIDTYLCSGRHGYAFVGVCRPRARQQYRVRVQ